MKAKRKAIQAYFPTWPTLVCSVCGHEEKKEEFLYRLRCPTCSRDGCPECMPAGRGCECPECEDAL